MGARIAPQGSETKIWVCIIVGTTDMQMYSQMVCPPYQGGNMHNLTAWLGGQMEKLEEQVWK